MPFVPDMIARVDADRAGSTVVVPIFFRFLLEVDDASKFSRRILKHFGYILNHCKGFTHSEVYFTLSDDYLQVSHVFRRSQFVLMADHPSEMFSAVTLARKHPSHAGSALWTSVGC